MNRVDCSVLVCTEPKAKRKDPEVHTERFFSIHYFFCLGSADLD